MLTLVGCSATGEAFKQAENPSNGKAVIYFYRPSMYQGSAVKIMIVDNGENVQRIQDGQFIRYEVDPGIHKLHTDTMAIDRPTTIDAKAGEVYYVRTGMRVGLWVGSWTLTRIYKEDAIPEISLCKAGKVNQ